MTALWGSVKSWVKNHPFEIRAGVVATLVALFFTQGLPLWDDDYAQWLTQANGDFLALLKRLLLPSQPSERPVQSLIYKILYLIFGTWGTGYFLVKSLVFGGLCTAVAFWLTRLKLDRPGQVSVVMIALSMLILSGNVLASLIWHSDFSVYSELIVVLLLFYSFSFISNGPTQTSVWRKGMRGLPKSFVQFLVVFFLTVYFGSKIRGDVRLVPVILLVYLYFFRKERFQIYVAPLSVTLLASLPWSLSFFRQLSQFSFLRTLSFLFGGMFSLGANSTSALAGIGALLVVGLLIYAGYLLVRNRIKAIPEQTGFFLVWFIVMLLSCGIVPPEAPNVATRYTAMLIVPEAFLLAIFLSSVVTDFGKYSWFKPVVISIVVLQCVVHLAHAVQYRKEVGHLRVVVDRAYELLEKKLPTMRVVLMPGFPNYSYKPVQSFSMKNRESVSDLSQISSYPPYETVVLGWRPVLDARFTVIETVPACASSLFDGIFPCDPSDGAVILKYIGNLPEYGQASQLQQQGNIQGARDLLDAYLRRDPGNHGVAFLLSLLTYQLRDFARMEQLYDVLGPLHPGLPSVTYNWGLSKQGLSKFKEAAKLFERAYEAVPGDYSVGFNLADTYYRLGKKRKALALLKELLVKFPNDAGLKSAQQRWSQ